MVFFRRKKSKKEEKKWVQCKKCNETFYIDEVKQNFWVCPRCGSYFRVSAKDRIEMTVDEGSFKEFDSRISTKDPLNFTDLKPYKNRLKDAIQKTGSKEAVINGTCTIDGQPCVLSVMDFSFLGGSMGYATGEKIVRAIEKAMRLKIGLVIISASGGARMQEGILSLMQMERTAAALSLLSDKGLPYISVLTDPTTGGVAASFAMLGDVIIAEPNALIGFAGPRVIEQTIGHGLPEGFQRSEFLLEKGFVDIIVERKELPKYIGKFLRYFSK
ncbi:acetyl-CoA carboxylase, carboxyltransferase subunit beta [Hippea maritima]|uniref:Acetyl-coenzyme A carboxylase carboxyl transferase subunit beta n=1 Tax=Hippea maritima (strain ATCC 700847 / DSM 10411 / MH2) TaxID=760142 RepID=F2LUG3_HIPMA|nr:acetyl-CoA carboxylase, carboxyltransferase subunit beta [Hippea maritima]AEA33489.1 Acetyl-coenzyme A carboxylase carboxyl transferase subunit beta [Hippea maritima DSM 10411]